MERPALRRPCLFTLKIVKPDLIKGLSAEHAARSQKIVESLISQLLLMPFLPDLAALGVDLETALLAADVAFR